MVMVDSVEKPVSLQVGPFARCLVFCLIAQSVKFYLTDAFHEIGSSDHGESVEPKVCGSRA